MRRKNFMMVVRKVVKGCCVSAKGVDEGAEELGWRRTFTEWKRASRRHV